jgi:hypothetical protein
MLIIFENMTYSDFKEGQKVIGLNGLLYVIHHFSDYRIFKTEHTKLIPINFDGSDRLEVATCYIYLSSENADHLRIVNQ